MDVRIPPGPGTGRGLLGVWFTHKGSVGERIYIAEYMKVGRRKEQ